MKKNSELLFSFIMIAGIIVLLFACERLEVNRTIKIETDSIFSITSNSAYITSEILDIGETEIINYGHCWSTVENPTITLETKDTFGELNMRGAFNSQLFALIPDTIYHVRAYATDKQGTVYGDQISFKTIDTIGTYIDGRDGKKYKWVEIGDQVWMAENHAYLPAVSPFAAGSRTEPHYYVYDYDGSDVVAAKATSNYKVYGVLYNWTAAMNGTASSDNNPSGVQGICPDGWHMPGDAEWKQLEMYLGMSSEEVDFEEFRGGDEGGKLKESGYAHWNEPNVGADNSSGFTALPGGWREDDGVLWDLRGTGCWWSATEYDESSAYKRALVYSDSTIERKNYFKDCAFSIRCVRDN